MLSQLEELDVTLFLFFNGMHNEFFDFLFYWISNKWIWIPLYAVLAYYLYKKEKKHFFYLLMLVAVMITLSDQISSSLIKNSVMRLRPTHDPMLTGEVHFVNNYKGGKYGFVSSHAANAFAIAVFIYRLLKRRKTGWKSFMLIWALIVSYSRIYLGVHYPADIIGGAMVGAILGYATAKTYRHLQIHVIPSRKNTNRSNEKV
ncbi:MAG: phosphatase PAP2 family protein [Bacteroidetes bacterium]|nr:MAG: phosphatase PAP2 family protein [Bacteroidota bacterium]REK08023.1 MAG: phosphatase PAP2 family protein [Bacteroidota bacterium]REK32228.1 MAG: phosphatase PAP2 family protein [Bacteroidota bacterium]REK47380.1 MAG: phosphatase PAP2 family protein [Bacteroidota bacterium]